MKPYKHKANLLLLPTESNIKNSEQMIGEPYIPNYCTRSMRTADQQTLRHILIKNGTRIKKAKGGTAFQGQL
jgi:hypothetical protein